NIPEVKKFSPVAILYQALQPPIIDGIRKPLKPGGYSDSRADIAYSVRSNNIPIVTPVDNPSPISDLDWGFPDTEEGISTTISKVPRAILIVNSTYNGTYPLNDITLVILKKKGIRFPAVIKPIRGRRSQGVKKIDSIEQMKEYAEKLLSTGTVIDVVAVIENSTFISNEEAQNAIYKQVAQDCEKAAQI
ncbi:14750_t:CDS:2, partial [Racocetra fulgida]